MSTVMADLSAGCTIYLKAPPPPQQISYSSQLGSPSICPSSFVYTITKYLSSEIFQISSMDYFHQSLSFSPKLEHEFYWMKANQDGYQNAFCLSICTCGHSKSFVISFLSNCHMHFFLSISRPSSNIGLV